MMCRSTLWHCRHPNVRKSWPGALGSIAVNFIEEPQAVHCGPWFCVSSIRCSPQFGALTQSQTEGAAVKLWREAAEYRATAANNSNSASVYQDRSVKCSNEWKLRPRSREASDKWLIKVRSARRPCGGL